ncbi:MAG: 2-oxoacid:acceptor oxidoreductase family protein [Planctomycetota bacterium]
MLEIRIHGRGGQGAVVASETLATAFFNDGKSVQTFPEFGVERRGAPVTAYVRADTKPVRLRCRIYSPDHLIILDPVLLNSIDVTEGLKKDGWILINSNKEPLCLEISSRRGGSGTGKFRIATVDATGIAIKYSLGPRTTPIVNTAILGAFCRLPDTQSKKTQKLTGLVKLKSLEKAIAAIVPVKTEKNLAAAREAYKTVRF